LKLIRDVCLTNAHFKDKQATDLAFTFLTYFVDQQQGRPALAPRGFEQTLGNLHAELIRAIGQMRPSGPSKLAKELKYLEH
jgi:hypothetical protein